LRSTKSLLQIGKILSKHSSICSNVKQTPQEAEINQVQNWANGLDKLVQLSNSDGGLWDPETSVSVV